MYYKVHHDKLIERAKDRLLEGYSERHHIIPRCMGGTNESKNIVRLTAREHYVIHQLLIKIYPNNGKLAHAAHRLATNNMGEHINSKEYGWIKKRHAQAVSKNLKGKPQTPEHIEKRAKALRGKGNTGQRWKNGPLTEVHRQKISSSNKGRTSPMKGKSHNEETKIKISESSMGRVSWNKGRIYTTGKQIQVTCPHCNKTGGGGIMKRWHFNNCKTLTT